MTASEKANISAITLIDLRKPTLGLIKRCHMISTITAASITMFFEKETHGDSLIASPKQPQSDTLPVTAE